MAVPLRRDYAQWVTSGAQLLLLFGVFFGTDQSRLFFLALMAIVSVFAWLSALQRLRLIRDTPTSSVASAAQGYVELFGRGKPFADELVISPLRQLPCLWYRFRVEEHKSEDGWTTTDSGESSDSFILSDESGDCVVDPDKSEILTKHYEQWQKDGYRYSEWSLIAHDKLHIIGEFSTRSGILEFDSKAELNALLAEWKQDKATLHARFDLNNDGELDMQEWMLARQAAKREVSKKQRQVESQPDIHFISKPRDGKLFLISNLAPENLSRRYLFWSWTHVVIFLGTAGGIGWLL
jgi:hypothetical protein